MKKTLFYTFICILISSITFAGNPENETHNMRMKTDANIVGHVTSEGEHMPFVTIALKGTTIGTVTDETGHFRLIHLPVGEHTLVASFVGYKPTEIIVNARLGETSEINIDLEPDALGLEEVVVTGDRNERKRSESAVIVSSLGPKLFANTNSASFAEALNFAPGLRLENNCQNCGFTQVRMNGMEGTYSQVLINSRAIFSGLAGVYGLELIPSNMIERIEVVKGAGSAMYGSNAIAGTINVILKDPLVNSFEVGLNSGIQGLGVDGAGRQSPDNHLSFNASMVTADQRTGLSVFGFRRNRSPFDANNDEFSEVTMLDNITIGSRLFHRFGTRSKLSVDFFNINEERRGGNDFEKLPHMADVAESAKHNITTGSIDFKQFFRGTDVLTVYASGQLIGRDTYYGAEQSLSDYGTTDNFAFNTGVQYKAYLGSSGFTAGVEVIGENLVDKKLGYPENIMNDEGLLQDIEFTENTIVADQSLFTSGIFAQYDLRFSNFMLSAGGRFDRYSVEDKQSNNSSPKTGNMFSPRINLMYTFSPQLQARVSYSQGYRAPQIFDEDLHIETSGARKVIHINDPDLEAETSQSYMASVDHNRMMGNTSLSILVEGFYTTLFNPFVLEFGEPDANGVVEYVRQNAEGNANVRGINTEINIIPSKTFSLSAGITLQKAEYDEVQEFGEKRFFRSPES
ncbi:MAG: TonB-dependent receptor, partial [Bacteroidota bacterium]